MINIPNIGRPLPKIDFTVIPEAERDHEGELGMQLHFLNYWAKWFEANLRLYECSAQTLDAARRHEHDDPKNEEAVVILDLMDGWPVIAARDGAMSIYHFAKTLNNIDNVLARMPSLAAKTDRTKRKEARNMLRESFPDHIDARDAVAHAADKASMREKEGHSIKDDFDIGNIRARTAGKKMSAAIVDFLHDNTYTCSWEGKLVSYKIDIESLKKIAAIRDLFYDSFPSVHTNSSGTCADQLA